MEKTHSSTNKQHRTDEQHWTPTKIDKHRTFETSNDTTVSLDEWWTWARTYENSNSTTTTITNDKKHEMYFSVVCFFFSVHFHSGCRIGLNAPRHCYRAKPINKIYRVISSKQHFWCVTVSERTGRTFGIARNWRAQTNLFYLFCNSANKSAHNA